MKNGVKSIQVRAYNGVCTVYRIEKQAPGGRLYLPFNQQSAHPIRPDSTQIGLSGLC